MCSDDSSDSVASEDSILGFLSDLRPPERPGFVLSKADAGIPAIFLVEGEKNRKLLRQDDEIRDQIEDEHRRAQEKKEAWLLLRLRILDELNDNGSDYLFSWKKDRKLVELYMDKVQNSDPSLVLERRFYYFRKVPVVSVELPRKEWLQLLVTGPCHVMRSSARVRSILARRGCSLLDLLLAALKWALDPTVLALVEAVLTDRLAGEDEGTLFEWLEVSLNIEDGTGFAELMLKVGASLSEDIDLKLVHFNNNVHILVYRLSLIFQYYIRAVNTAMAYSVLRRSFILSSLDFHLNKRSKDLLAEVFMVPVFCALIELHLKLFGSSDSKLSLVASDFHETLVGLQTRAYGEPDKMERAWEHHYTFLETLLSRQKSLTLEALEVLDRLVYLFLGEPESARTLRPASRIFRLSMLLQFWKSPLSSMETMFSVKLVITIVTKRLNEWQKHPKEELYELYDQLQVAKLVIQRAIGDLQLASVGSVDRLRILGCLGEIYRDFEYLNAVLEKNRILMQKDEFYET